MTSIALFADEIRRGLWQQTNVIFALLFKDFRSRSSFSAGRLGVFWTVTTPVFSALALATLWAFMGRHDFFGVSPYLAMTASVVPWQMASSSLHSIPYAIGRNMDLYGYPQVKPIDALLARFIVDATLDVLAGIALLAGLYWFAGLVPALTDPLATLGMFGLLFMFMLGVSLIVGIYSTLSDTFDRVLGFLTRPLIFGSLVIHIGYQLPPQIRYWVSWNPLADIMELIRYYLLGIPAMPEATVTYPAFFALLALALGLIVYYANRHRILRQE
jgi:capsular polysaccharide transport system permease protein